MKGGKPIFESAPESRDGIAFRGVRRKEEQPAVGGKAKRARFVKRSLIEEEEVEAGRIRGGKMVEEEWKPVRSAGGQFEKAALPRERFHRAVQGESLEVRRRRQERWDATSSAPTAQNRQEPPAPFGLPPPPPLGISLLVGTRDTHAELRRECGLELRDVGGLFGGCERRGALSFAFNLSRPSLCPVL